MKRFKFAWRKLRLQGLEVKKLSKDQNSIRFQEQKTVKRKLLTNMKALFTTTELTSGHSDVILKHLNILTNMVKNDELYRLVLNEK